MKDGREPATRRWLLAAVIVLGIALRGGVVFWSEPWAPHHPDEHILALEGLTLWEGITPREVGWPGSTARLTISAVEACTLFVQKGATLWRSRHDPVAVLETIAAWSGYQYTHPETLYKIGRVVSIVTGAIQLLLLIWALRQWTASSAVVLVTAAVAITPMAVLYSQYVLADMAALLFATWLIGLAAAPTPTRVVGMAVLAALAASSKFHFGIWILTPLCAVWLSGRPLRFKLAWTGLLLAVSGWIVVSLVPWTWTNPVLALKEFLGVVAVKMIGKSLPARLPGNIIAVFGNVGLVLVGGAAAALIAVDRIAWRRLQPVAVTAAVGSVVLLGGGVMLGRYALAVLPGFAVMAAVGWEKLFETPRRAIRTTAIGASVVLLGLTAASLVSQELTAAESDVDVLVANWLRTHVRPESSVAVHDEINVFLPRNRQQLERCATVPYSRSAYQRKWDVEGFQTDADTQEPMRSMLLTDEFFEAFWCSRELAVGNEFAFRLTYYHHDRRFRAVLEEEAFRDFADGRIDVLVANREAHVGLPPVETMTTRRGRRLIYVRDPSATLK